MNRRVDLIGENFDLDLRVGEVQEPHLIAHRITESSRILCAAPAYIERRGEPKALAELPLHDCLLFRDREQSFGVWRLQGPTGLETVKVTGPMASNHSDIVRRWAHDGYGIIIAFIWDVAASLETGALGLRPAPVPTACRCMGSDDHPLNRLRKGKVCVEFLKEQLTHGPYALRTKIERHATGSDR
jgi:LysR family transcriptional activator of dmlA